MNFKKMVMPLVLCAMFFSSYAQDNWRYVSKENISFKMPDNWRMVNTSKVGGAVKIMITDSLQTQFVEFRCEKTNINLKVRATDLAAERSSQPNFDYMQIDKVKKSSFKNREAQQLNYTNTYLNDVFKGTVYTFVNEGYTYSVEYYGDDKPQTQQFLLSIANTFNVNPADKKENINDMDKDFTSAQWSKQEVDRSAEIAAAEAEKAAKKAEADRLKAKEKEMQAKKQAEKQAADQQKKLEKQQKKIESQQKKLEQKQKAAEKAKQKREKEQAKAEKKRIEKENKVAKMKSRLKTIDKDLNSIADKQLKYSQQYGQAQTAGDVKKTEKIQKEQTKLSEKVTKLNKEKEELNKKLSKIQ
ncbi:MAG: hypothetical protein J6M30_03215 [Bacteroidales bacterium]|nr:hypothetical protein [Bacteroidales bacterium]